MILRMAGVKTTTTYSRETQDARTFIEVVSLLFQTPHQRTFLVYCSMGNGFLGSSVGDRKLIHLIFKCSIRLIRFQFIFI